MQCTLMHLEYILHMNINQTYIPSNNSKANQDKTVNLNFKNILFQKPFNIDFNFNHHLEFE